MSEKKLALNNESISKIIIKEKNKHLPKTLIF